jgi:hypothetical protein
LRAEQKTLLTIWGNVTISREPSGLFLLHDPPFFLYLRQDFQANNIYMRLNLTHQYDMTPNCRDSCTSETGLSEVVGFVLILGVLVLVASLFLTYGIPAQGRENEILHMNEVKDQFVTYKVGLDSLFNNNKVGTTLSNSFTLGTGGGYTQGMMSFMPIMSPVSSSGTIAINPVGPNQRVTDNETLQITSRSLILNTTNSLAADLPAKVNFTPSHVYINISGIQPADLGPAGTFGANVSGRNWVAYINLTPQVATYQNYSFAANTASCPVNSLGTPISLSNGAGVLCPTPASTYLRSDITVTIIKNGVTTMQDYSVYRGIASGATTYTVDLMDDAYGLNTLIRSPSTITLTQEKQSPSTQVLANGNITYGFTEMNPYTVTPIALGSVEYQSQNNYWIRQNYYYQMGGVFLQQSDGNTTYKLPPEITFAYDPANPKILVVNINGLSIDPGLPSNHGIVGGNSPIQLKTTLTNITTMPFVPGTANTRQITIGITTTDNKAREMWRNYFDYTAQVAGMTPNKEYSVGVLGTTSYITLYGYYNPANPGSDDYDINVIASNATYLTTVHGVGGIVQ